MDVIHKLNDELLKQKFTKEQEWSARLDECKQIALSYARIENSIAVLSDMKTNTSYIFYGGVAERLGLAKRSTTKIIHSIWEEEIFSRIHPDDLLEKHLQELRFFNFLKTVPKKERTDYYIANNIRMRDGSGLYVQVLHRMFYIASQSDGSIRLALCLYNLSTNASFGNIIINSADGCILESETQTANNILSGREKEVLQLIDKGKMSKEIASVLSISINTVNRHRQNILEKLHVDNSIEACRIAKGLNLF
ncbi:helix-turn-helix transcriptional regulator [uncultured Bacteroides sp.]|uniref:response regulator transcription factor n=1 Tax=uncultured Bacteroides sp. TaxID=162156 RepID=UPI002AAAD3F1|nr:helix-turn-helix transcriptional regulator [uncultured Bacteroides sp.]